jgi:uncharacterized protein YndB with AHSA1/START domain
MTQRSVVHATFVIERILEARPERAFRAWASPEAKSRWFGGPDEWKSAGLELDFRVGGRERLSGGPAGGPVHTYSAIYWDIVPNARIVSTYEMHMDDTRISVSLATLEFRPEGAATRLILTEQGAFLDGWDDAGQREAGTRELIEKVAAELARQGADA